MSSSIDSPKKSTDKQTSVRFGTIERISSGKLRILFNSKECLDGKIFQQSIAEWEEKFGVLRREYEMERQQRRNLTKILVEMSRDMKLLLNSNKNGITNDPNV